MLQDCIFCKIAANEIPVKAVYEDEDLIAFPDVNPVAPVHLLVIPKKHIASILEAEPEDAAMLGRLMAAIPKIAAIAGLTEEGFRTIINTKDHGGQTVYHLHLHILGGRSMTWPPG